jgi:hypothetical protein
MTGFVVSLRQTNIRHQMRNNTKLKALLMKYTVTLDMDDDQLFRLVLTGKDDGSGQIFDGASYGMVLSQAYSYLLKQLKKPDDIRHRR